MTHNIVIVNKTHRKSDTIIKLTTVIKPIELIPVKTTISKAQGILFRKEVKAIKAVRIPVVKM